MSRFHARVRPVEVGAVLACRRPPEYRSVTLEVLRSASGDDTRLEDMLRSVLLEVVTGWPNSTIWVTQFDEGYLQGWHESPTMLLEFHRDLPLDHEAWVHARDRGWIDPTSVPMTGNEFESRAVWGPNPVQELRWSSDGLPAMVKVLDEAAQNYLGFTAGDALEIKIWRRLDEDEAGEPEVTEAAHELDTPIDLVLTSVRLH